MRPPEKCVHEQLLRRLRPVCGAFASLAVIVGLLAQLGACRTPPTPDEPQAEPTTDDAPSEQQEPDDDEDDQSDDE